MKKLLLFIGAILSLFVSNVNHSQELELREVISASPEAAALAKFVNTPVNYSNGLPNIQIPFYTIQTRSGLSIPIYISYHASGIKVNEHATQVGLGWKLSTGGMISTQTYGEPDDIGRQYPPVGENLDMALRNFNVVTNFKERALEYQFPSNSSSYPSYIYALSVSGVGPGIQKNSEVQPDINYYEIPTGSGKFVYDFDFKAHPIPYAPIEIKSGITSRSLTTIEDQNGNLFSFGEKIWYSTIPNRSQLSGRFIQTHKITNISTPLNEEINYFYSDEHYTFKNQETFIDYTEIIDLNNNIGSCGERVYYDEPSTTIIEDSRLDRVEFDNGHIEFHYSDSPNYQIENSAIRKDLPGASALRRVVVYNKQNEIIKDFELFYSYFESTGIASDPDKYRLKLDRVEERGQQPYNFTYMGNNGTIPHRLSTRQDYWGYYGGSVGGLLPAVRLGNIDLQGSDRSVDDNLIKTGALEKITYPTGGSTHFYFNETTYTHLQPETQIVKNRTPTYTSPGIYNFELPSDSNNTLQVYFQNTCGESQSSLTSPFCSFRLFDNQNQVLLEKSEHGVYNFQTLAPAGSNFRIEFQGNLSNNCSCSLYIEGEDVTEVMVDKKTQLPGLRLDRMVAEPLTGTPIVTTFDYKIPGTNRISKDISIPVFHYTEETNSAYEDRPHDSDCIYLVRKGTPAFQTQTSYTHVKESILGNGHTDYRFHKMFSFTNNIGTLNLGIDNIWSGKMISKEVYSESEKILSKEEHSYEADYSVNQNSSDYRALVPETITLGMSFANTGSWNINHVTYTQLDYNIYHINGGWLKNKQSINTMYYYDDNDALIGSTANTTNYFYNNPTHAQVTRTETTNSKGQLIESKTYYPDDVNALTGFSTTEKIAIERLQKEDLHQIGVPIQTETTVTNDLGVQLSKTTQRTLFKDWGNDLILPEIIQTAKDSDPLEDRLEYTKYDSKGNILEAKKSNGSYITYLWGYDQQYPIAKIDNATFAEVASALNISETALLNYNETDLLVINGLRASLPKAMVSTYIYKPLVGVTSMTDPRGYTMTYEYDAFNRLEYVRDQNGKIYSKNEYNYKNQ